MRRLKPLHRCGGVGAEYTVRAAGTIAQPRQRRLRQPHRPAAAPLRQQRQRHRRPAGSCRRCCRSRRLRSRQLLKGEMPAGTPGGVHVAVALHRGDTVLLLEVRHQLHARLLLRRRHLLPVEAALEAYADAVIVVVPRVSAHRVLRSAPVHAAVLPHKEVVPDAAPSVGQMPLVHLLGRTRRRRRVVQDDAPGGAATRQRPRPFIRCLDDLHRSLPPLSFPPCPSAVPAASAKSPARARPAPPRSPEWRSAR